jgi:hypothetical protein
LGLGALYERSKGKGHGLGLGVRGRGRAKGGREPCRLDVP